MALSAFLGGIPAIELVGIVPVGYLGLVTVVVFSAIFTRKKARRDAALEVLRMLLPRRLGGAPAKTPQSGGSPSPERMSEPDSQIEKGAEPAGPAPSGRDDRI